MEKQKLIRQSVSLLHVVDRITTHFMYEHESYFILY